MIVGRDRLGDVLLQHGFNLTKTTSTSTRSPGCCRVKPVVTRIKPVSTGFCNFQFSRPCVFPNRA
jgi:hypothetical protein